jgi:hypothetical protein
MIAMVNGLIAHALHQFPAPSVVLVLLGLVIAQAWNREARGQR